MLTPAPTASDRAYQKGWAIAEVQAVGKHTPAVRRSRETPGAGKVLKKPFVETTEAEYDEMFGVTSEDTFCGPLQAG